MELKGDVKVGASISSSHSTAASNVRIIEVPKYIEIPKFIEVPGSSVRVASSQEPRIMEAGGIASSSLLVSHEQGVGDGEVDAGEKEAERLAKLSGKWTTLPGDQYITVGQEI